uniref:Uncharacterized protein n=1 Tax=Setaria italica TaxID=4555 RepID=K3ZES2_SETIT
MGYLFRKIRANQPLIDANLYIGSNQQDSLWSHIN